MTTLDPIGPPSTSGTGTPIPGDPHSDGPGPSIMSANTLRGDKVMASDREDIGKITEIMIDVSSGRVAYAVLSSGGFLGMGDKLYAIPWNALTLDIDDKCFRLDISSESLKNAPGFDKDHWPSMADTQWGLSVHHYYHRSPYWVDKHEAVESPPLDDRDPAGGNTGER